MSDTIVRSRIYPVIKAKAAILFDRLGLTLSDAIRLFLYQSVAEKRLPFTVSLPNAKTLMALDELANKQVLKKTSIKQLKADWDEACEK